MVELEVSFTQRAVGYTGTSWDDGVPHYDNGQPKYDDEGYELDENGNRILDGDGNPIKLPTDDDGVTIMPEPEPSPSGGGGSQELADQSSGWFEQVEITEEET